MSTKNASDVQKLSLGGLLISLGIIFGDIGTSPLYVFKAIINKGTIEPDLVLGDYPVSYGLSPFKLPLSMY